MNQSAAVVESQEVIVVDALLLIGGLLIVFGWVLKTVFRIVGFLMFGDMNPGKRRCRMDDNSPARKGESDTCEGRGEK